MHTARCIFPIFITDYPVVGIRASVRTGQYDETGQLWSVEFTLPDRE